MRCHAMSHHQHVSLHWWPFSSYYCKPQLGCTSQRSSPNERISLKFDSKTQRRKKEPKQNIHRHVGLRNLSVACQVSNSCYTARLHCHRKRTKDIHWRLHDLKVVTYKLQISRKYLVKAAVRQSFLDCVAVVRKRAVYAHYRDYV